MAKAGLFLAMLAICVLNVQVGHKLTAIDAKASRRAPWFWQENLADARTFREVLLADQCSDTVSKAAKHQNLHIIGFEPLRLLQGQCMQG
jgi:hypothetical protein